MRYASETTVSVEKSQSEIRGLIRKYGADQIMFGESRIGAVIQFYISKRLIQFNLMLPERNEKQFTHCRYGRSRDLVLRSQDQAFKVWEQSCRQKWRALCLVIKAKLEAVESGISMFEEEFLAHIVMPDGRTIGNWIVPMIEAADKGGHMPKQLPMPEVRK